jgi:hypothetical protein
MTVMSTIAPLSRSPCVVGGWVDVRKLASGELAEGTVLRAGDLEARYGVSRTVVRDAVRSPRPSPRPSACTPTWPRPFRPRAMQAIIEEAAEAMPGPTDQPTVTPSAARR